MISVVVPTVREEKLKEFKKSWKKLFDKHRVELVVVHDGKKPYVEHATKRHSLKKIMGRESNLIYNLNDGVRNLGFAYAIKYLKPEIIITLDDDVKPYGDTIQQHIEALKFRVNTEWLPTCYPIPRGVPYGSRVDSKVVLSHGIWYGVKDWDAPSQLINGNPDAEFFHGVVPKGVKYPMCGMNIAFTRELFPYMYYAPMGHKVGLDRFADIWAGVETKRIIDKKGWAVVSGLAVVNHDRASNVYTNLIKEAQGLKMNENYGKDHWYWQLYAKRRKQWKEYVKCNL